MSRNGSGTYSLPVGNPVVTGTTITSTWANTTLTDIASALTGSLAADGQTTASGALNMGTNKVTNAADPTNPQDLATKYYTDEAITAGLVTVTPAYVSDKLNTATGYFQVPLGTVLERPASPQNGIVRYNTDGDFYEGYIDGDWVRFQTYSQANYTASYVVVAGGGGCGGSNGDNVGGGGGAGGYLASTISFAPGTTYTVTVGAGGAGTNSGGQNNGANSLIFGVAEAIGGGAGGQSAPGSAGGSGGGAGGSGTAAAGTMGQGNNGGVGYLYAGGGGGGAGANGGSVSSGGGGNGGVGLSTVITGSTIFLAGGGAGNGLAGSGSGGNGGGGTLGSGTANTGGGGGAPNYLGISNGGSGVVYISVPTVNYSATTTGSPTVTTNGANTVMKFNSSGSYTA